MIIDDEPDARAVVSDIAEELELQVRMAENGQLGLDEVAVAVPDVIILDLLMPVLDGFGVLAALRSMPKLRATPVIVCTAVELDQDQRAQLEADTAHVVAKGEGTVKQLRELLRSVLSMEREASGAE